MECRVREIERLLTQLLRRIGLLESRLTQAEQAQNKMGGGMAPSSGGAKLWVGEVTAAISAGGTGTFQPYDTTGGGWAPAGDTFAVRNLGGAISTGKKCAAQADQSGTMIVSPLC